MLTTTQYIIPENALLRKENISQIARETGHDRKTIRYRRFPTTRGIPGEAQVIF